MSALDDQLAALHAEAQAKANALVAQAKADEAKKDVSGSALTDDEVAGKLNDIKVASSVSAPHDAFSSLLDIVKHLLAKVAAFEQGLFGSDAAPDGKDSY